jgi:hypothetical protein
MKREPDRYLSEIAVCLKAGHEEQEKRLKDKKNDLNDDLSKGSV